VSESTRPTPSAPARVRLLAVVGPPSAPPEGEPGAATPTEDELVLRARPMALRVARIIARIWRVQSPSLLRDCEQAGCLALVEARPGYDKARGTFEVYAWKRVAGAVTRLLQREVACGRTGFDDELDEAEEFRDASDAFSADDSNDLATLKVWCRRLAFTRMMGVQRRALQAQPDNAALRAQVFQKLELALGGLNERETRVIDLRWFQSLTWKEVGDAMHLSDRQVKRIDHRVRNRLERDLRGSGVDEPPPSEDL
jgi:RNA polymerase sigma factor for flagellar operon FliA